ncbi:MAG: OB-fold domain-containing protein [Acidimicrobiia bacterium]
MRGIIGYGTYVPYHRLQRSAIADALGTGGGRGTRAVASYDEDATSMAVEASRNLVRSVATRPDTVLFATATPPYLDKTNATVIHAALDLPSSVFAADVAGSARCFDAALRQAVDSSRPTLVAAADVRTGRPSSSDEANGGDAAVALLIGSADDGPVIAEWVGGASSTHEFLDRWRLPDWNHSRVWEERFGEHVYVPLAVEAVAAALKDCDLSADDVDVAVVTGLHARAVRLTAKAAGLDSARVVDDLAATVGNSGTAHPGLVLASALDQAEPGQTIMVVHLADGCTASVFRTTEAIASYSPSVTVAEQVAAGDDGLSYNDFLTWRGVLEREPPRRPDPESPAAPPTFRSERWKYAFVGSRDRTSGAIHLPPQRVSVKGGTVDDMELVPMADVPATVATFTVDRLAYSLAPPTIAVVIDFDGGGRFTCQLTDASEVAIGDRVQMTFRRIMTANGIHNYFWKAKPLRVVPGTTRNG